MRSQTISVGDVRDSFADITSAGKVLGFSPSVGFEDGVARTVEWLSGQA